MIGRHPVLLRRWAGLGSVLLSGRGVPPRERELVILRTAWRAGSVYEFGQHTLMGSDAGLTGAEIRAVAEPVEEAAWSDDDLALIAMVDELCASDDVSDGTWRRLRARWEEPLLVELIMLAGYYRMLAGFLNAVRVPLEPGVPGWPGTGG